MIFKKYDYQHVSNWLLATNLLCLVFIPVWQKCFSYLADDFPPFTLFFFLLTDIDAMPKISVLYLRRQKKVLS